MSRVIASNLDPKTEALAQEMVVAIEAGDVDSWGAAFASSGESWHSYSGTAIPAADNVELLRGLFAHVIDELRYDDVRRTAIDGGYVQQHVLQMRAKTGAVFSTGVCLVVRVEHERVTRIEEYLDSSVIQFGIDNSPEPAAE